jgi:hypothetical protein
MPYLPPQTSKISFHLINIMAGTDHHPNGKFGLNNDTKHYPMMTTPMYCDILLRVYGLCEIIFE